MQLKSTTGEAATTPEAGIGRIHAELPVGRPELGKLARWIPTKEMALLFEIFDRAGSDPDLTRPALLLCLAYAERVARMLDQDPFPTVTNKIRGPLGAAPRETRVLSTTKSSRRTWIWRSPPSTSLLDLVLNTGGTRRCAARPLPCEPASQPRSAASRAGSAGGSGIPKAD